MKKLRLFVLFSLQFAGVFAVSAQNATDVHRYSTDRYLGDAYALSHSGAFSMFYGSMGSANLNPAAFALARKSEFSFSLGGKYLDETGNEPILGFSGEKRQSSLTLPDFSYLFKVPTESGSLVLGWSIAQTNDYSRSSSLSGLNNESSILDAFARDSYYRDTAWEVYALDSVGTTLTPIWRLGTFQGMWQDYALTERGNMHELNFFWATEFKKNVFVGASVVLPFGSYTYSRQFVESDFSNVYNNFAIGNDITDMVTEDVIESNLRGAYYRVGLVAKPLPWLSLAASYRSPLKLNVEEEYSTTIQTRFDNNDSPLESFSGSMDYSVRSPARYMLGAGFDFTTVKGGVSAEFADFSNSWIGFDTSVFDRDLALLEKEINNDAAADFKKTTKIQAALELVLSREFSIRVSAAKLPETRNSLNTSPFLVAGGFSMQLTRSLQLDAAVRHSGFESASYAYQSTEGNFQTDESVRNTYGFATLRFGF